MNMESRQVLRLEVESPAMNMESSQVLRIEVESPP